MANTFRKGQLVTVFFNFDRNGSVKVVNLVVHSCGKKQMILVDEAGVKFQGHNFYPTEIQYPVNGMNADLFASAAHVVKPRMTDDEATSFALTLGAQFAQTERETLERTIARYTAREGVNLDRGYLNAMNRKIAEIHEPRVVR